MAKYNLDYGSWMKDRDNVGLSAGLQELLHALAHQLPTVDH